MARAVETRRSLGSFGNRGRTVGWAVAGSGLVLGLVLIVGASPSRADDVSGQVGRSDFVMTYERFQEQLNLVWVIAAGGLALLMKAGFTLAETGLVRAKNAAQTAAMTLGMFAVTMLGFWVSGFAWMFGGHGLFPTLEPSGTTPLDSMATVEFFHQKWDLLGLRGFFLAGVGGASPGALAVFFLHAAMLDASATIPTGAMLERWRFASAMVFGFIASAVIVPIYGGWVWGGGWLADLGMTMGLGIGMVDFAGSGVIHLTGGVMALAGSLALGPRIGKSNSDGTSNAIPGHNVPMVVVGSLILAVGWFGLNVGRTLDAFDSRIATIATTTLLASASGCLTSFLAMKWRFDKPDPTMGCNGLLAGLVAISAPCAFVSPAEAVLIGALAGFLVVVSILFIDKNLGIDDPVGAISVHGVCGAFGLLCVGLFAGSGPIPDGVRTGSGPVGFFTDGTLSQLGAQTVGIAANLAWVFPTSLASFALINRIVGNRVAARAEIEGLDVPEMGVLGYVGEETYAVRTAGQDFLATFGPGVPAKSAAKAKLTAAAPLDRPRRRRPK